MGSASSAMSASPFNIDLQYRQAPSPSTSQASSSIAGRPSSHRPDSSTPTSTLTASRRRGSSSSSATVRPGPSTFDPKAWPDPSRNGSISTTLALPLSKVDLSTTFGAEEKEEGEISETEEKPSAKRRKGLEHQLPARPPHQTHPKPGASNALPIGKQKKPKATPKQKSLAVARSPPPVHVYVPRETYRPPSDTSERYGSRPVVTRRSLSASTQSVIASAPSNISPEDARAYMDIIRNLLQEGFAPDTLIKRGATAEYVAAVCEEIVKDTRRRKEVVIQAQNLANSPDLRRQAQIHNVDSTVSSDVEIIVSTDRRGSISSEGSAENMLLANISPPYPRPLQLYSSSHWSPEAPPVMSLPTEPAASSRPTPTESYKPPSSPFESSPLPVSPVVAKLAESARPTTAVIPDLAALPVRPLLSTRPYPAQPSKIPPTGPRNPGPNRKVKARNLDSLATKDEPVVLNYDEDSTTAIPPTPVPNLPQNLPNAPLSYADITTSPGEEPTPLASLPAATVQDDAAVQQDLLQMKKKLLQTMKLRKKMKDLGLATTPSTTNGSPISMSASGSSTPLPLSSSTIDKTIEQEVMDLEREVMGLQPSPDSREIDMDIDEPEDGEIMVAALPLLSTSPIIAQVPVALQAPHPIRPLPRGLKRPGAEDFDSRPTSSMARSYRKPFGPPQNLAKLLINLDEDDSDSDSEETSRAIPQIDLMAEHEAKIQRLKAQIAARMKERGSKRVQGSIVSEDASPLPSPVKIDAALPIAEAEVAAAVSAVLVDTRITSSLQLESLDPAGSAAHPVPNSTVPASDVPLDDEGEISAKQNDELPVTFSSSGPAFPPHPATFSTYTSLMRRYPQLPATSLQSSSYSHISASSPREQDQADPFASLNRPLLNSIILTHRLAQTPQAVLCMAEVGGGLCADPTCGNIHLDKGDPSVDDWTEYVVQVTAPTPLALTLDHLHLQDSIRSILHTPQDTPRGKGKGKAREVSSRHLRNTLSSDTILAMILAKIGQALAST